MNTTPDTWLEIEETARKLGVSDEAIRKWKERGHVPGKWHLSIISAAGGRVPVEALRPDIFGAA